MLFVRLCAQGARNAPLLRGATCLAFARSPDNVFVDSGILLTTPVEAFQGMLYIAQCCPIALVSPIVVSMNVRAKDMVPAGTPVQSSSGMTPTPRLPPLHVYLVLNFAPSA